jgi:hypothetical protein
MEMILPDGNHVRFGPSEWIDNSPNIYPKTTVVTGYCNTNPMENDESLWIWSECVDEIDFSGLWFAARGGGGGTYGVVTSVYYQLHDYPGALDVVVASSAGIPNVDQWNNETRLVFTETYIRFLLQFLFTPSALNVTEDVSATCHISATLSLNPFHSGQLFCYNSSGAIFVEKWQETFTDNAIVDRFVSLGLTNDTIQSFTSIFFWFQVDSFADLVVSRSNESSTPLGHIPDTATSLIPILGGFPQYKDSLHSLFPLDVVRNNVESLTQILAVDALTFPADYNRIYAMGGAVEYASDGMNSLSPTRRTAAFLKPSGSVEFRDIYFNYFFKDSNMADPFPGTACHNHANIYNMGPLKSNWTKSCPVDWPQSQRNELCVSQGEAFWGTDTIQRLQSIKIAIDPLLLFICAAGVGYGPDAIPNPLVISTSTPAAVPTTSVPQSSDESKTTSMIPTSFTSGAAVQFSALMITCFLSCISYVL